MTKNESSSIVPRILHNTAATSDLTWEERVVLRRNKKLLRNWDHMLWTNRDIDELIKESFQDLYHKYSKIKLGIIKSDLGRYAALYKHGGVYADTDYKFIRYPSDLLDASCTLPVEHGDAPPPHARGSDEKFRLGNAILASAPGHPFWRDLMVRILERNSLDELHSRDPIETTGPIALTNFLLENKEKYSDIKMPETVMYLPDLTWSRSGIAKSRRSVGIHMCWGSWRGRGPLHAFRVMARRKVSCII